MEAGRELDALIAEKVMGLHITEESRNTDCPVYDIKNAGRFFAPISPYSTSIAAAWEVVFQVGTAMQLFLYTTGFWEANLLIRDTLFNGEGSTAPLAICHAALKAIE